MDKKNSLIDDLLLRGRGFKTGEKIRLIYAVFSTVFFGSMLESSILTVAILFANMLLSWYLCRNIKLSEDKEEGEA
jgi:hypothetical protein